MFKEVAIIRHPRIGEYAFGFITSTVILRKNSGAEELCCVYVPTNHLYLGDVFLINSKDIMRPNLSVREGIGKNLQTQRRKFIDGVCIFSRLFSAEIVISGGLSIPQTMSIVEPQTIISPRIGKYEIPQV